MIGCIVEDSRRQIVYGITVIAAFAVGVLVGKSACRAEAPPEPKTKVVTKRVPAKCDTGTAAPDVQQPDSAGEFERQTPQSDEQTMPDAPPAPDPAARKRLLAWVRDQSVDLRGCRSPGGASVQLTVTLDIDKDGVRSVNLNAPEDEISDEALGCLQRRMQDWKAPADLIEGRKRVVFGLDL